MENESRSDLDKPIDTALRPQNNQALNVPAEGQFYHHLPQPQFAFYPPHQHPSTFQHGMYPTHYPIGPLHAPYAAYPVPPQQPTSFHVDRPFYPPPSYAYGFPSNLPQQPVDPRFAMGAAAPHEQATFSPPSHVGDPRGIPHQYQLYNQTHTRPHVQANNPRVGIL